MTIQNLAFIDSSIAAMIDLSQVGADTQVIMISPDHDGIEIITKTLSSYQNLQSVQVFTHGSEGSLTLGRSQLNNATLAEYTDLVRNWKSVLAPDADLLLFGCDVAVGDTGKTFVQRIAELTGADVAASTNLTGNDAQGGDWELEYQTGNIESESAFTLETLAEFDGILLTVSTELALRTALSDPSISRIELSNNITLTDKLSPINRNVTISGDNPNTVTVEKYTISGNNAYPIFHVQGGNVTLQNLKLANGLTKGRDGEGGEYFLVPFSDTFAGGGGGGLGAGGALYLDGGTVFADALEFNANKARGGNGGLTGGGFETSLGYVTGVFGGAGGGLNGTVGSSGSFGAGGWGASTRNGPPYNTSGEVGAWGAGGGSAAIAPGFIFGADDPGAGGTYGGSGAPSSFGTVPSSNHRGGGGAGVGGAVFIKSGDLTLLNSSFSGNSVEGGSGYENGQGVASELFNYGGTVAKLATSLSDYSGTVTEFIPPTLRINSTISPVEGGATNGRIVLRMDRTVPVEIPISYVTGGTATQGVDYELRHNGQTLSSQVNFPANTSEVILDVIAIDDTLYDPTETINLSLNNAIYYAIEAGAGTATLTIADNEPTLSLSASSATITEGNSTTFTISLDKAAPHDFSIPYTVTGTATGGNDADYVPLSGVVSVAIGETGKSITLNTLDDLQLESDETVTITLNSSANGVGKDYNLGSNTATLTVEDNEVVPTASLALVQAPIEGSKNAKFRLNLSNPPVGNEISGGQSGTFFYYTVTPGTATPGTGNTQDYTDPNNGKIFVPTTQSSVEIELPITNDTFIEPSNETFSVTLAAHPTQANLYTINTSDDTVNFTLTEDETTPTASISLEQAPVEGSKAAKFRIDLTSGAVGNENSGGQAGTVVRYQLIAGTATQDTDFQDLNTTVGSTFIPYGQTTKVVEIAIPDDLVYENPDETFSVQLLGHPGLAGTPNLYQVDTSRDRVNFTIDEDDILPTAGLVKLNDPEEDGEVLGKFNITLAPEALTKDHTTSVVTVGYEVVVGSNSAMVGNDYAALSGSVTLAPGDTSTEIVIVPVDDTLYDPGETVTVRLKNPANNEPYVVGSSNEITFTILDDDHLYEASLTASRNASESGNLGGFTLTLDRAAHADITIDYTLGIGDAIEGADYTPIARSVTIAQGQTTAAIQVQAQNNQIDEGNRILTLEIAPPYPTKVIAPDNNYQANPSAQTASIAIEDNDTAGTRLTALGNITSERGTTAQVEVRLETRPTDDVTITLTSNNANEAVLLDGGISSPSATVTFTPDEWQTAKTIAVLGIDDVIEDGDRAYTITSSITSADSTYAALAAQSVTLTNLDDDGYGLLVNALNSGAEGDTTTYTLALTQAPSEAIPVEIVADAQTLVSIDGTTFGSTAISQFTDINPQTVYVRVIDDTDVEGLHSSTIEHRILDHSDPNYPKQTALTPARLSLSDNDSPIVNIISADAASEASVIAGRFAVALDQPAPAGGITVNYSVTSSSATSGTDYRTLIGSAYIEEGSTGIDITVNPLQDNIAEIGGETVAVSLMGGAGYTLGSQATDTVTIFDDDQAGIRLRESGNTTQLREEVSGDSYTLELTSQPTSNVIVDLSTSGEVTPSQTRFTFTAANWNVPQTVTLPQVNDSIANGDRTQVISHSITSSDANYNGLGIDDVTIKIIDNDIPGIQVSQSGFTTKVTENGASDSYTIALKSAPINPVTINLTSPNNAITNPFTGKPELALSPSSLAFNGSNWNQPQTVTVTAVADNIDVDNRVVDITHTVISTDPNYNGFAIDPIAVAITEDDVVGINITDAFVTAMAEGGAIDQMTIGLNSQPTHNVTIDLTSSVNSITNPFTNEAEIQFSQDQLVFTPNNWNTPQTVTATVVNDDIDVNNRQATLSYTVSSTDPTYDALTINDVVVDITEDDTVGLTIRGTGSRNYVIEGSDNPDFIEIDFASQPINTVTISFITGDELEAIPDLVVTPENWSNTFSIPVFAKQDTDFEALDRVPLSFTITSNDPQYDPNSGVNGAIAAPPALTFEVADRQLNGGETATGLDAMLTQINTALDREFLSINLPLLEGSLQDYAIQDFIDIFQDNLVGKVREAGSIAATEISQLMETAIRDSFDTFGIDASVSVMPSVTLEEMRFDIAIGNRFNSENAIAADFGIPALGLAVAGLTNTEFTYALNLGFGWHEDFGFFVNTETTGATAKAGVTLSDDFQSSGSLGLLGLDLLNNPDDPTRGIIEFELPLRDLDNTPESRYLDADFNGAWNAGEPIVEQLPDGRFPALPILGRYDINGNGNYDAAEGTVRQQNAPDDGNRLTLIELFRDFEFSELFTPTLNSDINVGLQASTNFGDSNVMPKFLFDLDIDWDTLTYKNGEISRPQVPTLAFNNLQLDLGSFVSDFAKPVFTEIDRVIDPFRPILDFLQSDVPFVGKLPLVGPYLDNNGDGSVTFIEFLEKIPQSKVNVRPFVDAIATADRLSRMIVDIANTGGNILVDIGSYTVPLSEDSINSSEGAVRLTGINAGLRALPSTQPISPQRQAEASNAVSSKTKSFLTEIRNDSTIDFPILTQPGMALELLLGKEDVTLFSYDLPKLEISASFDQQIPLYPLPLVSLLFEGDANISADLAFGFDTQGLANWAETNFNPLKSYLPLDGFYISDRENADGTGIDVPEFMGNLGAKLEVIGGVGAELYANGLLNGNINVDFADQGGVLGDGKIRAISEFGRQLTQLRNPFDLSGKLAANAAIGIRARVGWGSYEIFNEELVGTELFAYDLLRFEKNASDFRTETHVEQDPSLYDRTMNELKRGLITAGTLVVQTVTETINTVVNAINPVSWFDGPIAGSLTFFDANFNGIQDNSEPFDFSRIQGGSVLTIPGYYDANANGRIDLSEGQLVARDGVDLDTFQEQRFPFFTAPQWIVGSPLTTLAVQLDRPDLSQARAVVARAFGLPSSFDFNPDRLIRDLDAGDGGAIRVARTQAQVQNLLILGANSLATTGDRLRAATQLLANLTQQIQAGQPLNLSDSDSLRTLITKAAATLGTTPIDLDTVVADLVERNKAIQTVTPNVEETFTATLAEYLALDAFDDSYSVIVNDPWNSLVRAVTPQPDLAGSEATVKAALGLPDFDLGSFNPIEAIQANLPLGLTVYAKQVQLNATWTQLADIAIGFDIEDADTLVVNTFIKALKNRASFTNLGDPDAIARMLNAILPAGSVSSEVLTGMAMLIADSNAKIDGIAARAAESGELNALRQDIAVEQRIIQGLQSQLLQSVALGEIEISQVRELVDLNVEASDSSFIIEGILEGTDGDDTLIGGKGNEILTGFNGNDSIQGGAGDDRAFGNQGRDTLLGEDGNDLISGGRDADIIRGGNGFDIVNGNRGDDLIEGGDGIDLIYGGQDSDTIYGDSDDDQLLGDKGNDLVFGGDGNDIILGGDGIDNLQGDAGNDLIFGNLDADLLVGADGNDSLLGGRDNDRVVGGFGDDFVFGNKQDDFLEGDDGDDYLGGGQDNDYLIGGNGDDTLSGDLGFDTLIGGTGFDVFHLHSATDEDVIADFTIGEDVIKLAGFDIITEGGSTIALTFEEIAIQELGGNTALSVRGERLAIFNGIISLQPSDFLNWG